MGRADREVNAAGIASPAGGETDRVEAGADPTEADADRIALAQPTRARLFALMRESGQPLATAELAELAGMHPNGIRNHLERLWQAGLVDRRRSSGGRGRPRDEWTVTASGIAAESALVGGDPGTAALAGWLARAFPTGETHLRRIESIGREAGLEMPVETSGDPKSAFLGALNRLGFDAVAEDDQDGFSCRLGRCPYREAARENSDVVCALHLGITRGLLESVDPELRLRKFEARDPDRAGCLIGVGTETGE